MLFWQFTIETLDELNQAVDIAAADDNIRVVSITGAGGKAFALRYCMGDLNSVGKMAEGEL